MPASFDKNSKTKTEDSWNGIIPDEPRSSLVEPQMDDFVEGLVPRKQAQQLGLPRGRDYSTVSAFENAAVYMPALSSTYVDALPGLVLPKHFGFTPEDLQFTSPKSALCFYPWVLYSAGQAAKTTKLAKQRNWFTSGNHDLRVTLIGDSGGFQIQQGTISFEGSVGRPTASVSMAENP